MATEDSIRPAVLIPAFNNGGTLRRVIEGVLGHARDVLVLDDGSTDDTAAVLESFGSRIRVHRHRKNRGKGAALRQGFRLLDAAGFTHAITLDADGQLSPAEVPRFLDGIVAHPGALIVGERDLRAAGAPLSSRVGLRVSNGALRMLSGARLEDSQTGYRAYPLREVLALDLRGERFDLELEVLVKAAWRGLPVVPVPIGVSYDPAGGRISHFRPLRDVLRIVRMGMGLFLSRPVAPPRRAGSGLSGGP